MSVQPNLELGEALLLVYDEALPAVYGYLRRRVANDQVAEDLTSETFLAAVNSVRTATTAEVNVAWLTGIARHKLLDHYRRMDRDKRNLQAVAAVSSDAVDPWNVSLRDELAELTLADIGVHHRAALTLRYLDGLSVPEVATTLGRTVHATEALLVRARIAFRANYEIQAQSLEEQ